MLGHLSKQPLHRPNGRVPRGARDSLVHQLNSTLPVFAGLRKSLLTRAQKGRGVGSDSHHLSVGLRNVNDRRTDDGLPRCHVFESFCRADKARRLTKGKWQQTDVPTSQKLWKLGIRSLAKVMNVRRTRERFRGDLDDGSHHRDLPRRTCRREISDQLQINPLINHAIISKSRRPQALLIDVLNLSLAGCTEMAHLNAAREAIDRMMFFGLSAVEAWAARKHHVCEVEQGVLALNELFGCV